MNGVPSYCNIKARVCIIRLDTLERQRAHATRETVGVGLQLWPLGQVLARYSVCVFCGAAPLVGPAAASSYTTPRGCIGNTRSDAWSWRSDT